MIPDMISDEAETITLLRPGKPGMAWTTEAIIDNKEQTLCIFDTSFPVSKGNFFVRGNDILGVTKLFYAHASMDAHIQVSFTKNVVINAPKDESEFYVKPYLINNLQTAGKTSDFKIGKLIALCNELNFNFQRKNTYTVLFCIRAIIDHIPPIFSARNFNEVIKGYNSWPRTDKKYIQNLARDRNISDDALHRQISTDIDLVDFSQSIPNPIAIQSLLREVIKLL